MYDLCAYVYVCVGDSGAIINLVSSHDVMRPADDIEEEDDVDEDQENGFEHEVNIYIHIHIPIHRQTHTHT